MIAIIDIGSNSVRLMLWADGKSLYKRVNTTRLGEGIAHKGELSLQAIERTAQAVAEYAAEGQAYDARVYAFATAAVRSAKNGEEVCKRVKELCGITVDVVSGADEALLGLNGALTQREDGGIIDIGGASTEVCLRKDGEILFSVSLDVGAVRLYDKCVDNAVLLSQEIEEAILPLGKTKSIGKMYVVGGTASTLAAIKLGLEEYDGAKIQGCPITYAEIKALAEQLLRMSAEERKGIIGMDTRRADIIAGGALLLSEIMKKMDLAVVYASDRDNLEGYLTLRGLE